LRNENVKKQQSNSKQIIHESGSCCCVKLSKKQRVYQGVLQVKFEGTLCIKIESLSFKKQEKVAENE